VDNCWAACLGDCAGKISREHTVSKSLYISDTVTVEGFPWCKDKPKEIGLGSLTAKILCEAHNRRLSDVDKAGAAAFDAFRQSTRLMNVRSKTRNQRWTIKRFIIDGPRSERWFLKTLINLCFGQNLRIGADSKHLGWPSCDLVEIAFGLRAFNAKAGLYSIVQVGQKIRSDDTVRFAPLIMEQSYVAAGLFSFRGFKFLLCLGPNGPPPLAGAKFDDVDLGQSTFNFHNEQGRAAIGKHLSHVVHTRW
jgi:hypothetical protein